MLTSVRSINDCAKRMARDIEKLTQLEDAPLVSPLQAMQMVDLEGAKLDFGLDGVPWSPAQQPACASVVC